MINGCITWRKTGIWNKLTQRFHRYRFALFDNVLHGKRSYKHAIRIDDDNDIFGRLRILQPVHERQRLVVGLVDVGAPVVRRRDVRRHGDRPRIFRGEQTRELGLLPANALEPKVIEPRLKKWNKCAHACDAKQNVTEHTRTQTTHTCHSM